MNEIKQVHLGRQQFTISIEAYKSLRNYLDAIADQPGVQPEVVREVEMRMAELLRERGIDSEKVVLQEDVDYLKEQLGEPRDFKDEDAEDKDNANKNTKDEDKGPKRLYRDTKNGMIAGVASGLAAYTNVDVLIIRIIFVALSFASGIGILVYILLWILAPEAKTTSERLQMRGKAVNLDSLKAVIDRADIPGASERAGQNLGSFLSKTSMILAKVISVAVGLAFLIAGIVMFLATVAISLFTLLSDDQLVNGFTFPVGAHETWFMIAAFAMVGILGMLAMVAGLSIMARKARVSGWVVGALAGVVMLLGTVIGVLGADIYPSIRDRAESLHITEMRETSPFNKIVLQGTDTTFVFKPDTKSYLEFSYFGKYDTELITSKIENDSLIVDSSEFMKKPACKGLCISDDRVLTVIIHAPTVASVSLAGTENSFSVPDQLQQADIAIDMNRDYQNYVHLSHMIPERVSIVNRDQDANRQYIIQGIKAGANLDYGISMFGGDGNVVIEGMTPLQQLSLNTDPCGEGESAVRLDVVPTNALLNDVLVNAADLQSRQTASARNVFNCVTVNRQDQLED